jgi:Transposase
MSSSDNNSSSNNYEGVPPNKVPPNKPVPVPVVMRRRRYTVQQKRSIIWTVAYLNQQKGMCHVEVCRDMNIHPSMHLRWMKQAQTVIECKRMNMRARSTHAGCIDCLSEYAEALLSFIFEL